MELGKQSDAGIPAIADPTMDNLMETPTSIGPARHVRDCADRLNKTLMKEYLVEINMVRQQQGIHSPSNYVTELLLVQQDSRSLITHVFML